MLFMKHWLQAFRLRTLPLALASILMGSFLAAQAGLFDLRIFVLCALTTIFLQVLSNVANDYGDSIHGADHAGRQGPARTVQSGLITAAAMRRAMWLLAGLSLLSGCLLLYVAFWARPVADPWKLFGYFLGLGVLAILAAIGYTAGKRPYGYMGLGDLSVFLFFGWVAVAGTYFLHGQHFHWALLLPASSSGFLAVGVLNINNIRDIASDKEAGKYSVPVRIGRQAAVYYHWALLGAASLCALVYLLSYSSNWWAALFVLTWPLLWRNAQAVQQKEALALDPYLKQLALSSLLFTLLFGIGGLL